MSGLACGTEPVVRAKAPGERCYLVEPEEAADENDREEFVRLGLAIVLVKTVCKLFGTERAVKGYVDDASVVAYEAFHAAND